ncbi:MAG: response regulator transcription factor [Oscillospiraceae bacterium]|jgi:DNA-binding response OmpR family regulator|nr:response regulator transcription factor [Oscillospiraceae bacterium]MBQ9374327.1 response regulator transcription factor [Oscillospiraceae bacterium]
MINQKIILADDEERWRLIVHDFLDNEGYSVLEAADGSQAVRLLRENPDVSLVILDVMMPVMDGIAACTEIRTFSRVPVLMVTARGDEETEVSAMRCGADQFISKPIKMRAFMERVRSLLRRAGTREVLRFGRLEIDLASNEVLADGEPLSLTPKEYDLLLFLAQTPDTVRSREQILHAVWNTDYYGDGRTVDTHVKNLRMKLGDCGSLLRTVRSRGYMLESGK